MTHCSLSLLGLFVSVFAHYVTGSLQCYTCVGVSSPDLCNATVTCSDSEECFVEQRVDDSGNTFTSMGCQSKASCDLVSMATTTFGRSVTSLDVLRHRRASVTKCFRCCDDDLCNAADCQGLCRHNVCLNGGNCTATGNGNAVKCACTLGYTGSTCETKVDHCHPQSCQNGASCTSDVTGFTCHCAAGFTGPGCQTDVDECQSVPCQNGGTCQDLVNAFRCSCPHSWTGPQCQTSLDPCVSSPCQHGGTCTSNSTTLTCVCPPSHTGPRCEASTDQGLTCLQCTGVDQPDHCSFKTSCASNQECLTEAMVSDGQLSFNLGCQDKQVCDFYRNVNGQTNPGGRSSHVITACEECCTGNECNRHGCRKEALLSGLQRGDNCSGSGSESSCHAHLLKGRNSSGVYLLDTEDGQRPFAVFCDMSTDGGGWTVFQRRQTGAIDFYRTWSDYKYGFGDLETDFWLGNDFLHRLTASGLYHLRVDLQDWDNNTAFAVYSNFTVGDEVSNYTMAASGYNGTAGDAMSKYSGRGFSTSDVNHDTSGGLCAHSMQGAWWYGFCADANLNGRYAHRGDPGHSAIFWNPWRPDFQPLQFSEMKLR